MEALEWYLSIFKNDIYAYIKKVYLIDDKKFIDDELFAFADTEINDEQSAIKYMNIALKFWKIRKNNIGKIKTMKHVVI